MKRDLLVYPMGGTADGRSGDHVLLAPPFITDAATMIGGSAFGKMFARLFAEQGLILLDPLDARLHRIAAPLYKKAVQDRDELNEKLLQRGKELEGAGYDVQVKVTARSTLLFTIRDGVRQPVAASLSAHCCRSRSE